MKSMGIDPGVEGYLCLVDKTDQEAIRWWPIPVRDGDRAGEGDDQDDEALASILRDIGPSLDVLVVEEQQGFPGSGPRCPNPRCRKPQNMQGVASTFKTGRNYGVILGLAKAFKLPLKTVHPSEWKPVWGLTADKTMSVAKAQFLSPGTDFRDREHKPRARVPNHNLAEAFILAKHGFRFLKGATTQ